MKDHHKDKAHPTPKGGGMPYFERDHWEHKLGDTNCADGKYSSQFNQEEEYKASVNALAAYCKNHKAAH